jgi:hypothetical protein
MLNRLLGGLVHPFIHLFYGFEFGILGQIAEGMFTVKRSILSHLSIAFLIRASANCSS